MISTMKTVHFSLLGVVVLLALPSAVDQQFVRPKESYCDKISSCCKGRQDDCSTPIQQTLCYCDEFCKRNDGGDCCPDYDEHCLGIKPPNPIIACNYHGRYYGISSTVTSNCNKCTCTAVSEGDVEMVCDSTPCIIQPDSIKSINAGTYGWKAFNYSFFWGKSLEDGYRLRAGICKPDVPVLKQTSINNFNNIYLEEFFDARQNWPGLIQPISDQLDFPASWAISAVDVAADRLAIQSLGKDRTKLSSQNIISCAVPPKNHCQSGSSDLAWWYLGKYGVVSEECYPYTSGYTNEKGSCNVVPDFDSKKTTCPTYHNDTILYRAPPAYRIPSKEVDIMKEIKTNGPVQALLHVKSDFFMYQSGIYQTTRSESGSSEEDKDSNHFLAVRIIGWGVETTDGQYLKYWICANSWGTQWGENGYFRIVKGRDESEVEMFVVAVWANTNHLPDIHQNLHPNDI